MLAVTPGISINWLIAVVTITTNTNTTTVGMFLQSRLILDEAIAATHQADEPGG